MIESPFALPPEPASWRSACYRRAEAAISRGAQQVVRPRPDQSMPLLEQFSHSSGAGMVERYPMQIRDRAAWLHGDHIHCLQPPAAGRPWHIILLGPPGVGKGTQALLLADLLRACPLSAGDIFRAERDRAVSQSVVVAQQYVRRGELVPDDIVLRLLRERRGCLRCHAGFILSGVPRTLVQAASLDGLLEAERVKLDAVIVYELSPTKLVERLSGRRVCAHCGAPYHLVHRPPARAGWCDLCEGPVVQRPDDAPDLVERRLEAYGEAGARVIDYYRDHHRVFTVSATGSPWDIFARTVERLSSAGVDVGSVLVV